MAETPEQRELQLRLQRERHRGRPAAQTSEARESMLEQRRQRDKANIILSSPYCLLRLTHR